MAKPLCFSFICSFPFKRLGLLRVLPVISFTPAMQRYVVGSVGS